MLEPLRKRREATPRRPYEWSQIQTELSDEIGWGSEMMDDDTQSRLDTLLTQPIPGLTGSLAEYIQYSDLREGGFWLHSSFIFAPTIKF